MENESLVTKERFIRCERRILNSQNAFYKVLWFLFALLWVGAIILFAMLLENPAVEISLCGFVVAYCIYKIALDSLVRAHFRYFVWSRRAGGAPWTRKMCLEDENIAVFDGKYASTYKYSQIKEITQFDGEIAFILYDKQAIIISSYGFIGCTREEFLAKIIVKKESGY